MTPSGPPLAVFRAIHGEPTWDDVIAGHDFGFLGPAEIQAWVPGEAPAARRLRALEGEPPLGFEAHLWAACAEAQGLTPRPGSIRWARAQDRWRGALLREALAAETTTAQLARRVERLYEQMGCPDDMLAMLRPSQPWSGAPATVDPQAAQQFLARTSPVSSLRPRRIP